MQTSAFKEKYIRTLEFKNLFSFLKSSTATDLEYIHQFLSNFDIFDKACHFYSIGKFPFTASLSFNSIRQFKLKSKKKCIQAIKIKFYRCFSMKYKSLLKRIKIRNCTLIYGRKNSAAHSLRCQTGQF